ncbi:MAG: hypothetical protein RL143_362 [Pseudomonadota bacterium]
MNSSRKIRLAVSLISFLGIVVPFMYLIGEKNSELAFQQNADWVIINTLVWVFMMALLLLRNPKWFGEETAFDILLRKGRKVFDWIRVK